MKKICLLLLAGSLSLCPAMLRAQTTPAKTVSVSYQKVPLKQALAELEQQFGVKIFYRDAWLGRKTITLNLEHVSLDEAIRAVLAETDYTFTQYDAGNLVLMPLGSLEPGNQRWAAQENYGKNLYDTKAELIGGSKMAPRGQKLTLKGNVKDGKRDEPVIGARISVDQLGIGTVSDIDGNYQLTLEAGKYEITYSAIGLETIKKTVQVNNSGTFDVELLEKAVALKEVEIAAVRRDLNVSGTQMGVNKLSIREIKNMPALLGEVDVIKSVQMLPGVTSVGEASAGFNVRGGNTDQNLILLDHVPIFNPTHLFGFFSVFNPDAVQDVTLYRGAIPAQLGGRLSSVLDVKQKEGSREKFQGTGGIGIVSARLALEGPVMKDKGSVLVAGRSSYSNWLFKKMPDVQLRDDKASFYDATIKLSANLSENSKYIFSGYHSFDSFQFNADTVYSWSTTNASLTLDRSFSNKLQGEFTAFIGDYDLGIDFKNTFNEAIYSSGIQQKGLKADMTYRNLKQTLRFGASSTYFTFLPGMLEPNAAGSTINEKKILQDKAIESGIYVNNEIELSQRLAFTAGLRFSTYQNLGLAQVFQYEEGKPLSLQTLTDTVFYESFDLVKPYRGLEPRFSVRFNLNENNSLKAGYSRTRQYMHVISNTLTVSPIDIWKTSNTHLKPQIGDQVALGFFRNMKQNTIETSVEVYYKTIQNQLDYKEGADLFLNEALETEVLATKGEAYGVEVMLKKKTGRINGWASYAFSRTFLQTNGVFPEEKINNNEKYPASYDKPHSFNLVWNYQVTRRYNTTVNFNYSTGRPFTAALSHYEIDGNIIPFYGPRNAYRLPDYIRLDVSVTMLTNHRKNKKWESSWNLGIYNVLGRQNAYSAFYRFNYGSKPAAYRLSILGTAIPSLTYNFKF